MTSSTPMKHGLLRACVVAAASLCVASNVQAQTGPVAVAAPPSLARLFEAAWARQPEAVALPARRDAARAQHSAAQAWTPEPAALELSGLTDRLGMRQGAREVEVGIAVPLWLPGERGRSAALAEAEGAAVESRASAAQLRVAATVREAWWQWQLARIDAATARDQLDNTRRLAADVARRAQAGDLARADQHQADGAVAGAEASLAQAEAAWAAASQRLRALTGTAAAGLGAGDPLPEPEAEPEPSSEMGTNTATALEAHGALLELKDRATVADRAAALAATQSRANPELTLSTTRDRGARSEASQQTLTLAVRIPFGAGPRFDARRAGARAEALEAQAQLALERERLAAEQEAARLRVQAARVQLAAANQRAQLARESRGFFEKSFRLGETDLPTRLRIEAEAAEADRQAARAHIERAAAVSAWRQALGLLPQ